MTEIQPEPSKCHGTLGPHRSYMLSNPIGKAAVSGSVWGWEWRPAGQAMGWSNSIERCRSKPQMRPDGQIDVVAEGPSEDAISSVVLMQCFEPESQDVYTQYGTSLVLFKAKTDVNVCIRRDCPPFSFPLPPRLAFVARALV